MTRLRLAHHVVGIRKQLQRRARRERGHEDVDGRCVDLELVVFDARSKRAGR